ncbi:kinesin-like nuclear fusion protein [Mortierella polycephala]|uniref:Kinesin-like nuclear fusion protein n=1 Tax=Mortierella polycephala TaxID=41804 RepID=A0A9P6QB73_9FUNG|nr:kinesin-like nuclear fusion protein [Mortierella polycephala]
MEQLNRSVSKIKPPATIVRSNSSSTLATIQAVAAAAQSENELFTGNRIFGSQGTSNTTANKDHSLTLEMLEPLPPKPVAGIKRKAEETTGARQLTRNPSTRPALVARGTATKKPIGQQRQPLPPSSQQQRTTRPIVRAPLQTQVRQATRPANTTTTTTKTPQTRNMRPSRTPPTAVRASTTTNAVTRGARTIAGSRAMSGAGSLAISRTQQTTAAKARAAQTKSMPSKSTDDDPNSANSNVSEILAKLNLPQKKKRAAWDTKGRLQDMEELTSSLNQMLSKSTNNMNSISTKLESNTAKYSELELVCHGLESTVTAKETEHEELLRKLASTEEELEAIARKHAEEIRSLQSQYLAETNQATLLEERLQQEQNTVQSKLHQVSGELEQQTQESVTLRSTVSTQSSNCLAFESDNRALRLKIERTEEVVLQRDASIGSLEQTLCDSQTFVRELQQKIREEEMTRRKLFNSILDLKSNIRVFCRVLPIASPEATLASIQYPDLEGRDIVLADGAESGTETLPRAKKTLPFTFDKVFQSSSTQANVFEEVSQLVQSALEESNVTILAYGQSGSGKTFTLEGSQDNADQAMGLIPRSVLQLFNTIKSQESNEWSYTLEGQYIEVYNEAIHDLLNTEGPDSTKTLEIQHCSKGKTTVAGATTIELSSPDKIVALLKTAAHNLSAAKSRREERHLHSHCIFTLRVSGKNVMTADSSESTLTFVDLAPSDRPPETGTKDIGVLSRSQSCLSDVFLAIANKSPQVPFRNSKLTSLLQHGFTGNSKMLMIVHISPLQRNIEDSARSLRFATKINSCVIGATPRRTKGS